VNEPRLTTGSGAPTPEEGSQPAAKPQTLRNTGRVVLITGGAGGLGQELTHEFTAQGWFVGAGFHRSPLPPHPESVWPIRFDVKAVLEILGRFGRLDALVNNAGVTADAPLWQSDEADWDRVLQTNLKGAFLCSQAALGPMLEQRRGHIVNIASFSGRVGAPGQANYAAAKAGLLGLTQSLAREVGARNVRVNAILPGLLPTAMTAGLVPETRARLIAANVLGRSNTLAEVARFVAFLVTLENISGQIFQLDSRLAPWS
jgi:3-oxoacyl-[acyl-carrier protein] reductase